MSDLFKRARKREGEAFAEFIGEHKVQLYKTAFSYFKNEQDSLDAVQEVTYRAYTKIHTVKKPEYAKTWLVRIMINYCLDELKNRKRSNRLTVVWVNEDGVKDPDVVNLLLIQQALGQLKEIDQTIIHLKYFHQYTLSEIAESLGRPIGTVKTQLHHALQA
ncbi:MAG TPA: sigma-70 family RNA polymerase sigma factor, partial [Candidatus Angelobacter sp.]|nr:sigma-70 family RNA polymerase sigma factor [Candidatus Angelobacter sp.]